eukprot:990140-Pyramimonas_sp.AAC.1
MTLCQKCNVFCARAASIPGHGASSLCGRASRCRAERLRCLLVSPPQWPAGTRAQWCIVAGPCQLWSGTLPAFHAAFKRAAAGVSCRHACPTPCSLRRGGPRANIYRHLLACHVAGALELHQEKI